jgi:hypothetical protein
VGAIRIKTGPIRPTKGGRAADPTEGGPSLRGYVLSIIKLGSKGGEFRYRTRIHKITFLIAQEFGLGIASFLPYHFGPWSPEVNDVLAELAEEGLVRQRAAICEEIDGAKHAGKAYSLRLLAETAHP